MNLKQNLIYSLTLLLVTSAGYFAANTQDILPKRLLATPLYKINLDEDPQSRWLAVARDYKNETAAAVKQYLEIVPKELLFLVKIIGSDLDAALPAGYADEIRGLSAATGIPLGDLVANVIYDFTAFCTGIIANDAAGGVWHGRNLDYGSTQPQTRVLERIAVRVDFVRGARLLYSGVTFAGYVGLLTAWKHGQFSLTVNERDKGNLARNVLSAAVELMKGGKIFPVAMVARTAMEQDTTFEAAVTRLRSTQLIAPVYYIVSGNRTDQGCVIVRDQFTTLGVNSLNQAAGKWFLVQTNYDPWEPPPPQDDRRDPAIRSMRALGQNRVNMQNILTVLSISPVLNHGTAYTSVFSATYLNQSVTIVRG